MVDNDFVLIDVPGMLAFSKRRSHREEVLQLYTTLCHFLQSHELVIRQLVDPEQEVPDSLQVKRELFTDEGYDFYRAGVQKWIRATDRDTPLTDTSILERELKKLRTEKGRP